MPVMMMVEAKGATAEQYDKTNEIMGVSSGSGIPGLICHSAALTDDGIQIVDVWESEEAFQDFLQNRLGPALGQVSMPPAEPRILPIHNHTHA
jgi:hypothetical protein